MAKAKAVLAGQLRPVWADQLLPHQGGEGRRDRRLLRRERLHGAVVEDLALDRAPFEHASLGGLELVEACGQQRLQGGRDDDLAVGLVGDRQHLLDEERVAAGGPSDPLRAAAPARRSAEQLVDVLVAQRLEPQRDRPGGAALDQLRPRQAEQQDRRARGEERDVLDQVEQGLLAPVDVVEHDDQRRRTAACSSVLRNAQAISSAVDVDLRLADQRADRRRGGLVGGGRSSCFSTSTTGQ